MLNRSVIIVAHNIRSEFANIFNGLSRLLFLLATKYKLKT